MILIFQQKYIVISCESVYSHSMLTSRALLMTTTKRTFLAGLSQSHVLLYEPFQHQVSSRMLRHVKLQQKPKPGSEERLFLLDYISDTHCTCPSTPPGANS